MINLVSGISYNFTNDFSNAEGRWAGLGPYYAMFPQNFAKQVIKKYSSPGQRVLDPFAGRATSIYSAAIQERTGLGIEINPLGWLYGKVKLHPAPIGLVEKRLIQISELSKEYHDRAYNLPEFFHYCFTPKVRRFLVASREILKWETSNVDATLMAFILVYLHGNRKQSLSNQMRQTKSMAPDYSLRWWKKRKKLPFEIDPVEFLIKRIRWRYSKGIPNDSDSKILFGDTVKILPRVLKKIESGTEKRFSLLFTSPPYCGVTNYHYDQWLRMWLLGESKIPISSTTIYSSKYSSKKGYDKLLDSVFGVASELMKKDSVIYVRTDAREFTLNTTVEILEKYFPKKRLRCYKKPFAYRTQTTLFGDKTKKPGEVDIILI